MGESVTIIGHPEMKALTASYGEVNSISAELLLNVPEEKCQGSNPIYRKRQVDIYSPILGMKIPVMLCREVINNIISVTAPVYPGNSGSPLLNFWGQVVGLVFATDAGGPSLPATFEGQVIRVEELKKELENF
jgi:hypothetical protein